MPQQTLTLDEFNRLPEADARAALADCCAAARWVAEVLPRRPYAVFEQLLIAADEAFAMMDREDWLAAFAAHPRIGDRAPGAGKSGRAADWSAGEQATGSEAASADERGALEDANRAYFDKFGYTFIVSATGKTADEILQTLLARLDNAPDAELAVAATEQMKITQLRLHKLIPDAL